MPETRRAVQSSASQTTKPLRKVFDFYSAKASLPLVRAILTDIMLQTAEYGEIKRSQAETPATNALADQDTATLHEIRKKLEVSDRMRELGEEMKRLGVCLIDLSKGIVGFPSMINGRLAFLLFQHKDEGIKTWRFVDQPLIYPIPAEWASQK